MRVLLALGAAVAGCFGAPAAGSGFANRPGSSRVIVRYTDAFARSGAPHGSAHAVAAASSLDRKVQDLQARPDVLHAKAMTTLGLAIVEVASEEAEERLFEHLAGDEDVELAVPDTWVSLDQDGFLAERPEASNDVRPGAEAETTLFGLVSNGTCAGHNMEPILDERVCKEAAAFLGLGKDLDVRQTMASDRPEGCYLLRLEHGRAPGELWMGVSPFAVGKGSETSAGDARRLPICQPPSAPVPTTSSTTTTTTTVVPSQPIMLRSLHGAYLVVNASGSTSMATNNDIRHGARLQMVTNPSGTVSLRSADGRYMRAWQGGEVSFDRREVGDEEMFWLVHNKDGTAALQSFHGLWVSLQEDSSLRADGRAVGKAEKFRVSNVGAPAQRFSDDPMLQKLWGMSQPLGYDIHAPEAWSMFRGQSSSGVVVAVIDTGIDYLHEDLRDQMWVNIREIPDNGIDDDGNGIIDDVHGANFADGDGDPMDDNLHGTHCAGTIAGVGNNGIGISGVAWRGVKLMALKFLRSNGSGRTSDAVFAVDYAVAHGAKVLSNSWGGGGSSSVMRVAIERAQQAGVLFVAAAGNSGSNNDVLPHYPSSYAVDNVISVASITAEGEVSSFSCFGAESVEVAAPGTKILSTAPGDRYVSVSGTSMACPHVSGLAALVWMYRPHLTMPQVKEIILNSTQKYPWLKGYVSTSGLINAKNALELASEYPAPRPPAHGARGIAFRDADSAIGAVSGTVTITAAQNESDIAYYKVYYVSGAGLPIEALGNVSANGSETLTMEVNDPVGLPAYARGLVVVAGNASGEGSPVVDEGAPHVKLMDYGIPKEGARAASWIGVADEHDTVTGTLAVTRAADEKTLTAYHIYWRKASGERGPLVKSFPAVGFATPKCKGLCDLLQATEMPSGWSWDRGAYGSSEQATISGVGPAHVTVTRMDTEATFDILTVNGREVSGQHAGPVEVDVPAGAFTVEWKSDETITRSGWSFELAFDGLVQDLSFNAAERLGDGFDVVSAFGSTEQPEGLYVPLPNGTQGALGKIGPLLAASSAGGAWPADGKVELRQRPRAAPQPSIEALPVDAGALPQPGAEPWLLAAGQAAQAIQGVPLWEDAEGPGATTPGVHSLRGAVTVPGVAASDMTPAQREAFAGALAAGLPGLRREDVRLRRVLATSGPAAMTSAQGFRPPKAVASIMQRHPSATTVEFEVRPTQPGARLALDRAEARLILLSRGGLAAERFDEAFVRQLVASGVRVPAGSARTLVAAPQQMGLRAAGAASAVAAGAERAAAAAAALGKDDAGRRLQDGPRGAPRGPSPPGSTLPLALAMTLCAGLLVSFRMAKTKVSAWAPKPADEAGTAVLQE